MSLGFNATDTTLNNTSNVPLPSVSSVYSVVLQNTTVDDVATNVYNGTQNVGFALGQTIGDFFGTTHMSVAPLDYVANWIFERLPSTVQDWYDFPAKNSVLIKKAIRDNDIDCLLKFIDQGESPQKILILSINQKNIPVIEFLLTLDIDIHQYGVYHDINTASTPYQAALISNYEIKKIFRDFDSKNQRVEQGPKPKNPWTLQFEEVVKELNNLSNDVKYLNVTNEFGNRFYEPVINKQHFNLLEIINKMDWQQVYFENECLSDYGHNQQLVGKYDEFYERIYSFGHNDIKYAPWIKLYISGHSILMNAFLKGEDHYNDLPDNESITKYWIANACVANDLNKRGYPDHNEVLLRGQSQEDRLVRYHHIAYASTTSDPKVLEWYQTNSPTVVFDKNFGIDVSAEYINNQTVFFPTQLRDYQLFIVEGKPFHLAETKEFIDNNECIDNFFINYNMLFDELINKIASNPETVQTHLNSNAYGQIYYDIVIEGNHYDMYELISNMDWDTLALSKNTLEALKQSKYQLWDAQVYTNLYSTKEGVDFVEKPIGLTEINQALNLLNRSTVPSQCGEQVCDYPTLYSDLSDVDKGLIFQYTSGSSNALNSFLKGSVFEFVEEIQKHKIRWNTPSDIKEKFNIQDPIQWWIYTARLVNALNKIKNYENTNNLCRGQTHEDRHLRLEHPTLISLSSDLKICEKYNHRCLEGDIVLVNNSQHAKDITGLSFHPLQKEFLHPPAFLNSYKQKNISGKSYLTAEITKSKMGCPKAVIKKATDINDLDLEIAIKNEDTPNLFKILSGVFTIGFIVSGEIYRRNRRRVQEAERENNEQFVPRRRF